MLSGAISLVRVQEGLLGPVHAWLFDKVGPRAMIRISVILFGLGFIFLSQVHSILNFYLTFFLIGLGTAALTNWLAITATIANWFDRKRSTAFGIAMMGFAAGGFLVPGIAWSLTTFEWRPTAFGSGVAIILIGLPLAQLFRRTPEQYGYLPDGDTPGRGSSSRSSATPQSQGQRSPRGWSSHNLISPREVVRAPAFWLISLNHTMAGMVVSAVMLHMIPHMVQHLGLSLETAAILVTVVSFTTIVGYFIGGYIGDRWDKRMGIFLCMLGHSTALVILAYATTMPQALAFAVLHGVCWGVRSPLILVIRSDFFGRANYARVLGLSIPIMMMGNITGPLLAGIMADKLGDYRLAFIVLAALTALGSVLILAARKPATSRPATVGDAPGDRLDGGPVSGPNK